MTDDLLNLHGIIGSKQIKTEQKAFELYKFPYINTGTVVSFDFNAALGNKILIEKKDEYEGSKRVSNFYAFSTTTIDNSKKLVYSNQTSILDGRFHASGNAFFFAYLESGRTYWLIDMLNEDGGLRSGRIPCNYATRYWEFSGVAYDYTKENYILSFCENRIGGDTEIIVLDKNGTEVRRSFGASSKTPMVTGEAKIKNGIMFARTYKTNNSDCNLLKYDYTNDVVIASSAMNSNSFFYYNRKQNAMFLFASGNILSDNFSRLTSATDFAFMVENHDTKNGWSSFQCGNCQTDDFIVGNGNGNVMGFELVSVPVSTGVTKYSLHGTYTSHASRASSDSYPNRRGKVSPDGKTLVGTFSEYVVLRR